MNGTGGPPNPAKSLALGLAFLVTAFGGYHLGVGGWLPGPRRTIALEELPVGALATPSALELPPLAAAPVRNVVLLIGDGMGVAQVAAARWAAFGADGRFVFERFPVVGLTSTAAAGSPVTDSAAAGTALATGVATKYGAVGVDVDGRPLRTILEAARDAGYATGLVTTSEIHDATPASFAAHVADRDERRSIAEQLATSGVDLLVGGGRQTFEEGVDLLAAARAKGVAVISPEELATARELPVWALFPGRQDRPGGAPPLADWTERALELLSRRVGAGGPGFFLMIEEEGIDSGAHARNLDALSRALLRFDAAVAAAARFAVADAHTLLLVIGDHATGGLSVDHTSTAALLRVAWASGRHTGEPVPIYAYGPAGAAEAFTGEYAQGEVAWRIAQRLGLDLSANGKGAP